MGELADLLRRLPGGRYQWLRVPVRRPEANPLRPVALATMLVAASELLARADRYGEKYPSPAAVDMVTV
ncbi:hypothetical protein [Streptomyces sp. NPDC000888]